MCCAGDRWWEEDFSSLIFVACSSYIGRWKMKTEDIEAINEGYLFYATKTNASPPRAVSLSFYNLFSDTTIQREANHAIAQSKTPTKE